MKFIKINDELFNTNLIEKIGKIKYDEYDQDNINREVGIGTYPYSFMIFFNSRLEKACFKTETEAILKRNLFLREKK